MIELTTVFLGSLASVFLLGFNSQLVRDKNKMGAFGIAWLITLANMMYTKAFVLSASFTSSYIAAGAGGSIGIVLSISVYEYYENRKKRMIRKREQKNTCHSKSINQKTIELTLGANNIA